METTTQQQHPTTPTPVDPRVKNYYGDEVYSDYPSVMWDKVPSVVDRVDEVEVVADTPSPLVEFSLNDISKRLIFKSLRDELKEHYNDYSDIDGFELDIDWGVFNIKAKHHYTWNDLFYNYNDEIEIVEVWDIINDCNCPTLPGVLNSFYKRERNNPRSNI